MSIPQNNFKSKFSLPFIFNIYRFLTYFSQFQIHGQTIHIFSLSPAQSLNHFTDNDVSVTLKRILKTTCKIRDIQLWPTKAISHMYYELEILNMWHIKKIVKYCNMHILGFNVQAKCRKSKGNVKMSPRIRIWGLFLSSQKSQCRFVSLNVPLLKCTIKAC